LQLCSDTFRIGRRRSTTLHAQTDIAFERPADTSSVRIGADTIAQWQSGSYDIVHLDGNVHITQGGLTATAQQAIIWIEIPKDDGPHRSQVMIYLEGNATIELPKGKGGGGKITDQSMIESLFTRETVLLGSGRRVEANSRSNETFDRAVALRRAKAESAFIRPVQFQQTEIIEGNFAPTTTPTVVSPQTGIAAPVGSVLDNNASVFGQNQPTFGQPFAESPSAFPQTDLTNGLDSPAQADPFAGFGSMAPQNASESDRFFVTERDPSVPPSFRTERNPNNPAERVLIWNGGIRAQINSSDINSREMFKRDKVKPLTILADNLVQWQTTLPSGETVDEVYVEGNVVFAKGERIIEADKMFYNLNTQQGTILNAEIRAPVEGYEGTTRIKADVLQQLDENRIQMIGSAFTTSQLGFPRYWLQSEGMMLTQQPTQKVDPISGQPLFDQRTGQPQVGQDYFLQAQNNRVYLAGVPVFAWPKFETNLSDPSMFIRRFRAGNDNIFGFQLGTGWDMYQLLGRRAPQGTTWTGLVDYFSERGIAFGTDFNYRRDGFLGVPGLARGSYKSWFINDDGLDLLGRGRGRLVPEEELRGRIRGNHRHDFGPGYVLRAELGYISDRNFLEQYYEREWDTQKDATTGLWLERNTGTQSINVIADFQVNDFFTQTSWLPRIDHFMIGQPLAGDRVVWHNRTNMGYGRVRVAEPPLDPNDLADFDPLAWEADVDGIRFHTRHELDFPMQVGPTKVVPYVIGDLGYWQEGLDGNDLLRGGGQVGIRASTFDFDAFYADASQDLDEFALYDPLDDDAQEHFRRRFAFNTFGITAGDDVPLQYDERFFALRSGLQGNVTSPSAEIFDDLSVIKFGARQRWQTKRGAPGSQRVVDWMTLDTKVSFFPRPDRDNFGADFGLFDYDFRWHIGDRVALVSDGFADFFSQGLRTFSVGAYAERPEIGSVYVGVRSIEGPISSNIISAAATYRLSDKWGLKGGAQLDFGEVGTIGQRLGVVYIGESFLWEVGFNYDASRDNFGVRFGFEPRFIGKKGRLFRPGNVAIPPASSRWLE